MRRKVEVEEPAQMRVRRREQLCGGGGGGLDGGDGGRGRGAQVK